MYDKSLCWLSVIAVLLLITGCALSDEPPIVRTAALPTVTPTVPPDIGRPLERIDLARGAEIYGGAQGCQLCHGITGEGNGPVAANITCRLVSFRDSIANQSKSLTSWFALVTNGNNGTAACPMPPWKNQLNEQDRWNVTSYIYSLHYAPARMSLGQQVWSQQCSACHSGTGTSSLPEIAINLADPAVLINRSDTQLFRLLTEGLADGTHRFESLSEEERWSVVAYTRSLGWDNVDLSSITSATPSPTAVAVVPDAESITVSGVVRNGTKIEGDHAVALANLPLTLRLIEATAGGFNDVLRFDTTAQMDGSFSFPDVPRRNGLVYVISTTYAGVLQTSQPIALRTGSGDVLDLSFTVYETTSDTADIRVEVQRIFVDFLSPTTSLIQQGMLFRNAGDRIFVAGDGIALRVQLPEEATGITVSRDSRGFSVQDRRTIISNIPFVPGETTLQFSYQLPFSGSLTVAQPTQYEIEQVSVHVPRGGSGFVITPGYQRDTPIQLETGVYESYVLTRPITAGSSINFSVGFGSPEVERRNLLAVLLFAAMVTIFGTAAAIWWLERRKI